MYRRAARSAAAPSSGTASTAGALLGAARAVPRRSQRAASSWLAGPGAYLGHLPVLLAAAGTPERQSGDSTTGSLATQAAAATCWTRWCAWPRAVSSRESAGLWRSRRTKPLLCLARRRQAVRRARLPHVGAGHDAVLLAAWRREPVPSQELRPGRARPQQLLHRARRAGARGRARAAALPLVRLWQLGARARGVLHPASDGRIAELWRPGLAVRQQQLRQQLKRQPVQ
jgi:hypothetical protein